MTSNNNVTDSIVPADRFSALFQPGNIGSLKLRNRLVMAAMGNALADSNGFVTEAMIDYYSVRAKGGVGLVITQFASVSSEDLMPYSMAIYDDKFLPGLTRLVKFIHGQGASVCIQLMHPGLLFLLLPPVPAGVSIKVPGITPRLPKDRSYRELTGDDIEKIILDFIDAAIRAMQAGADSVELHACHGCLLSSFLSPAINRRTDEYGGSVENRARFVSKIVEQIREKLGADFPLIVRINGTDDIDEGVCPEEVVEQALILERSGASAISISSGIEFWSTLMAPSYLIPEGVVATIAEKVKSAIRLPVIVAGKIRPEPAANIIKEGKADFVAWGRPLLANPSLPAALEQDDRNKRPECIYCNNCMVSNWRTPNSCTVNPFLYREASSSLSLSSSPRKIMVVGGGLAGMWSALLCRKRGHTVSLFEKNNRPGGQWSIACALPGKESYGSVIAYLRDSLEHLEVPLHLGSEVTRELVDSEKPDVVILATGAVPLGLDIPGGSSSHVVQANDVIEGKAGVRGKIVVVGGRILGIETALMLAESGHEVNLVSRSGLGGRRGPDDKILFRALVRRLVELRVLTHVNAYIQEITRDSIIIGIGDEPVSLPADTVVLAVGVRPLDNLAAELKGLQAEVYSVGDCFQPGNAAQAAFSAARWSQKI